MIFTKKQIKNTQLIKELKTKGNYKEAANLLRKNQQLNLKAQKAKNDRTFSRKQYNYKLYNKTFTAPTIAGYGVGDVKCSTYRTTNFTGYPPAPYMAQEVCENYSGGATSYILTSTAPTTAQTIYLSLEITYTLN